MRSTILHRLSWFCFGTVLFTGCASLEDYQYCLVNKGRAERAWQTNHTWQKRWEASSHYAHGWKAGYYEVSTGGRSEPPAVPPPKYWSTWYQGEKGQPAINDWYAGYQDGATAAQSKGNDAWHTVPTGPTVPSGPVLEELAMAGAYEHHAAFAAGPNVPSSVAGSDVAPSEPMPAEPLNDRESVVRPSPSDMPLRWEHGPGTQPIQPNVPPADPAPIPEGIPRATGPSAPLPAVAEPAVPAPAELTPTAPAPPVPTPAAPALAVPVPAAPVPTAPVPAAPVPTAPVPAAPVSAAPVPAAPAPVAPAPVAPAPVAPAPVAPAPKAPAPKAAAPRLAEGEREIPPVVVEE